MKKKFHKFQFRRKSRIKITVKTSYEFKIKSRFFFGGV